jgi:hypothetical protein
MRNADLRGTGYEIWSITFTLYAVRYALCSLRILNPQPLPAAGR